MDEARANQLGRAPLDPEIARIDAHRDQGRPRPAHGAHDDAQHDDARRRLRRGRCPGPDTSVLYLSQSGLGLPDRDYYLKDDAQAEGVPAEVPGLRRRKRSRSPGRPSPEAAAKDIVALETRLARSHWTNVESRDAVKTYNKVALADLPKQFPGLDWSAWSQELGVANAKAVIVVAAELLQGDGGRGQRDAGRAVEAVPEVPHDDGTVAVPQRRVRRGALRFPSAARCRASRRCSRAGSAP